MFSKVGGDTDGVRVDVMEGAAEVGKSRLRSAMEAMEAAKAAACAFEVGGVVALSRLGPTHPRMWSTKRCMSIFSPHFSQAIRPAGSLGLT